MGIFKYVCGFKRDENENRVYNILLVEFESVKDVIALEPICRYKFYTHKDYPELAKDIDIEKATPTFIEHSINFIDRSGYLNVTFDSLKECAYHHRVLVRQEKECIRKEAFTKMVNYSQIPFEYWGICYELAKNNPSIDFFMFRNIPCYRVSHNKEIYSVKDNTVVYYGDELESDTI